MGTSYYELRKPITHIDVREISAAHSKVHVWINHAGAGTLTVRNSEVKELLISFSSEKQIFHIHYGGKEAGAITQKLCDTNDYVVISEYGEIVSVKNLKDEHYRA